MRHLSQGYQKKQCFQDWVLPRKFRVEVAELTGALRDGPAAVGLKAAMVIAHRMLQAKVACLAGEKGKHQRSRQTKRHGQMGGYVVLGGRKVRSSPDIPGGCVVVLTGKNTPSSKQEGGNRCATFRPSLTTSSQRPASSTNPGAVPPTPALTTTRKLVERGMNRHGTAS